MWNRDNEPERSAEAEDTGHWRDGPAMGADAQQEEKSQGETAEAAEGSDQLGVRSDSDSKSRLVAWPNVGLLSKTERVSSDHREPSCG